ncbi:hypothetical protein MGU_10747 [Metarhizium guizhouense ARSEF 977]|uniref:F-box domain-containing protein n=1 Tax=Metarhizium guizhouense (strain ARSEF 977) TaxID=1276136 RepID=A0A0B4GHI9_METGA|nr:hypothetical protein MGU_10747 [Metarhizium guizhouense ARSEF 977]
MAGSISTFPPEVWGWICVLLSRPDLKNLRLVCRVLDEIAQRTLFETVFLRVNLNSFERLQDIARDDKLSQHVRTVSYDGRTLGRYAASQGFEAWFLCSAGAGLGLLPASKDKFLAQFSLKQLEEYYFNYCQSLFAQDHILRRNYEKEMLTSAFAKFPRLLSVQYAVKSRAETGITKMAPLLSSLGPVAREILAEPEDYHGYLENERHFWTLLQSACFAGHAHQLRSVRGSHLDLRRWNSTATLFIDCYRALPVLHHLSLEFELAKHDGGETTQLADMISHASSLTSLRLSFDDFSFDDPHDGIHLSEFINNEIHWEHLRSLSLQAVVTSEGCLRGLLRRHSQSLRFLELSNIKFKKPAFPLDGFERGSWILFIQFLSEHMSLDDIKFDGCFSNQWNEGWVTHDADRERDFGLESVPAQYPHDCLKYRIERYITHNGSCPFIEQTGEVNGEFYHYHNLPWVFGEDESWRFDYRLIQQTPPDILVWTVEHDAISVG